MEARTILRNQFLSLEFVNLAYRELNYETNKLDAVTGVGTKAAEGKKSPSARPKSASRYM